MIKLSSKAKTRRSQTKEADLLFKQLVHARDAHTCLKCQRRPPGVVIQAAHILSKGVHQRMRFELLNVITLCLRCHLYWAHKDPIGFHDWINVTFPGRIQILRELDAVASKLDMKELLIGLRLEVSQLQKT